MWAILKGGGVAFSLQSPVAEVFPTMRIAVSSAVAAVASMVCLVACTTNTIEYRHAAPATESLDATEVDAGTPAAPHEDAGTKAPDPQPEPEPPPAMTPVFPQLALGGGAALSAPRFQLVRYASDKTTTLARTALSKMGASSYWKQVTSEYGVGPATALTEVTITGTPPAKMDDTDVQAWFLSQLDGKNTAGLATPDGQTVYVWAPPASMTVTETGNTLCNGVGGYHSAMQRANGSYVPYIVLPHCDYGSQTADAEYTLTLSHEMVEAATDPYPSTGYTLDGPVHGGWQIEFVGAEAGDLCEFNLDQAIAPPELGFYVQRTWSNRAAALGHEPCVPAAGITTFGAFADERDEAQGVAAIKVLSGGRTIQVRLYSDGPMGAFTVTAKDYAAQNGDKPELALAFANGKNQVTGKSGDLVDLTITPLRGGTQYAGSSVLLLEATSADGKVNHIWPLLVAH